MLCIFETKLGPFLRRLFESIKRKVLWGQWKPHKLSRQTAFLPLYLFISLSLVLSASIAAQRMCAESQSGSEAN